MGYWIADILQKNSLYKKIHWTRVPNIEDGFDLETDLPTLNFSRNLRVVYTS